MQLSMALITCKPQSTHWTLCSPASAYVLDVIALTDHIDFKSEDITNDT